MARRVRGNRATRLARSQASQARALRRAQWGARLIVVFAMIGISILATALTYRAPDSPSVATVQPRAPGYHGAYCAYVHRATDGALSVASQVSALVRPWLE